MTKKIIFAGILAACLMSTSAFANTLLPYDINAEEDITIKGNLDSSHWGILVNLFIRDEAGKLVVTEQSRSANDASYSFTFNAEETFSKGGHFTVKTVSQAGRTDEFEFDYYLNSEIQAVCDALNSAVSADAVADQPDISDVLGNAQYVKILSSGSDDFKTYADDSDSVGNLRDLMFSYKGTYTSGTLLDTVDKVTAMLSVQGAESANDVKTALNEKTVKAFNLNNDAYYKKLPTDKSAFYKYLAFSEVEYEKEQDFIDDVQDTVILALLSAKKGTDGIKSVINTYKNDFTLTTFNSDGNDQTAVLNNILLAFEQDTIKKLGDVQVYLNKYIEKETGVVRDDDNDTPIRDYGNGGAVAITKPNNNYDPSDVVPTKTTNYKDLTNYEWAEESINQLTKLEIVSGTSADTFEPGRAVTRAELCKMVCGVFGKAPNQNGSGKFADVQQNAWYAGYINALEAEGGVTGLTENAFGPNEKITRQDAVTIIYRMLEKNNKVVEQTGKNEPFNDAEEISKYAQDGVNYLKQIGIVSGYQNDFNPKSDITRAEIAKIIAGIYNYIR